MLIKKEVGGSIISFIDGGVLIKQLFADCTINCNPKTKGFEIIDYLGREFFLDFRRVRQYQVAPAAAVDFTGDFLDLWDVLLTLFNELHNRSSSGGGGLIENNIVYPTTYYSISTTDYIICPKANITVRLPAIGTKIGMVFRVSANNFDITVACDDPAGDRIIGEKNIQLSRWNFATFRAIDFNKWVIAD